MLPCVLKELDCWLELPVNYNYMNFDSNKEKVQNCWNYSFHVQVRKFVGMSNNEPDQSYICILLEGISEDLDWIGLAQDRNRWRALVNSVLNLQVP
jgi:hypothetical protein